MAKVTPAQILYPAFDEAGKVLPKAGQQRIDFHSVISEAHSATAQVTKYPVQTGFQISNNSIRNNRVVTITGAITNTSLSYGSTNQSNSNGVPQNFGSEVQGNSSYRGKYRNYGAKATNSVFQELESLILLGTKCKVVTNLGMYLPVVWTKFETTQKEGSVDSMEFTLTGEEIIIAEAGNTTGSLPAAFTILTGAERDAELRRLAEAGYKVSSCDEISTANIPMGEDFHIDGVDSAGNTVRTSYKFAGTDPTTGEAQYSILLDDTTTRQATGEVGGSVPSDPCVENGFMDSVKNTAMQALNCITKEATDIALDLVKDTIDTAVGKLKSDLRGAVYDATSFGNEAASALAFAGVGCIARSISGNTSAGTYVPGESLPTADQMLEGLGNAVSGKITLTQIQCACEPDISEDINNIIPTGVPEGMLA